MEKSPRVARIGKECVACGCCVRACPKEAIQIAWGISAHADEERCVGCGKCSKVCPAAVIDMVESFLYTLNQGVDQRKYLK